MGYRSASVVLSVLLGPRRCVHGQTIGADGAGSYAFVFYGDSDKSEEMARAKIRQIEQSGQRVEWAILSSGEGYCGPFITSISVD